jgi:hypothetical protein
VATRAQAEKEKKPVTPLKVPDLQQLPVDIDKLKDAQTKDGTLECVRELVKDGRRKTTRGGQEYQYVVKKGVLYRIFTKKTGGVQIVVPQEYRNYVMELAQETIVGEPRNTEDLGSDNFQLLLARDYQ